MLYGKKNKVVYKLSFDRKETAGEIHYTFHKQEIPFNLKNCDDIIGADYFFEIVRDENKHCEDDPKLLFCILNNSDAQDIAEKSLMYMGYDVSDYFKKLFEVYHEDEIVKLGFEKYGIRIAATHQRRIYNLNVMMMLRLNHLCSDVVINNNLYNYSVQIALYRLAQKGLKLNPIYSRMRYNGVDFIDEYEQDVKSILDEYDKDVNIILHCDEIQKCGMIREEGMTYTYFL